MPYAGPTEINIRGEDWVRDGSWFVKKSLVDRYGSVDAAPPSEVEANRVSYPEGVTTQVSEERARNQGAPAGSTDGNYAYRQGIGDQEYRRRADLASSIGVNRSTDTSPAGVLADELFYGHIDELPGTGLYFSVHGPGQVTFKDRTGNQVPGNPQMIQAAMAEQKNVDARLAASRSGQAYTPPGTPGAGGGPVQPTPGAQGATKIVNGVTYQQQADGTWLKQEPGGVKTPGSPAQPANDPAAPPPQMSSMVGAQTAGVANLKAQPQDFWKGAGGAQPAGPSLTQPPKMPTMPKPALSNSMAGTVKQPTFGGMGRMKPPGQPGLPPVLA